ncbi:MAG: peptidoglycan editing factor PgeF [Actinomycetota bacterium]
MAEPEAAPYGFDTRAGLPVMTWPVFDEHPIRALVTTRDGGVSTGPYESLNLGLHVGDDPETVIENRRRSAAAIGLSLEDLVFGNQVHGHAAIEVGTAHRGRGSTSSQDAVADADALVTRDPGVGLAVMVADCVPIVLYDPATKTLACVHAGWRGTVACVAQSAVALMIDQGARAEDILAGIGPAIAPERYQVGDDVAAAVRPTFGSDADRVLQPDEHGRWNLDLHHANRLLLEEAGVGQANICVCGLDTAGGRFFSDRAVRPCGRFALLACLQD